MTADATEQWVQLALRDGTRFDQHAIALRVPDCGYKLRRIELVAAGRVDKARFIVASSGQAIPLHEASLPPGDGIMRGYFAAPVEQDTKLVVESFEAARPAHSGRR